MKSKVVNYIILFLFIIVTLLISYFLLFNNKNNGIDSFELNKDIVNLYVGESEKLVLNIKPDDYKEEIIWTSSNENIATVNDGLIEAKNVGTTIINAETKNSKVGSKCIVNVKRKDIEKIELNKTNLTLNVNETFDLEVKISPEEFKDEKLIWTSSNGDIVKVDNGLVQGISKGDAIITASINNKEAKCVVKVNGPVITPSPTVTPTPTPTPTPKPSKLEIHFINAGGFYDDAILIRSDKATIWMDGGRGKEAILSYLKELNLKDIDYIIGSHTEYDHIDAEGEIIKTYNVKNVIYANDIYSCGCRCDSTDVRNVKAALKSKNLEAKVQPVPSKLTIGDMDLFFIAPTTLTCNKNNNSFVFILKFKNNSFMFTGDSDSPLHKVDVLTSSAQKLGLNDIKVDVVKYPHHGNEWLDDNFLNATNPKYFIVPNMNTADKPNSNFMNNMKAKGVPVYRQSDSKTGNILITSDGNNIEIKMDIKASDYAR